jgi:LuxR family maltose regulon positive regulatory protein
MSSPTSRTSSLLTAKLTIPEQPTFMVPRPRLLDAMPAHNDVPITLVIGPAGSGKTQLAASWARVAVGKGALAWLTLEQGDGHSSAFWAYVVAALHRAGVALALSLVPSPSPAQVDRSFLVRLATELAKQDAPVLLVLDGASGVGLERWATDLEFVLRHSGPMLRLVLIGRWNPPLPLHRYRLAGRLAEIRAEDLVFSVGRPMHEAPCGMPCAPRYPTPSAEASCRCGPGCGESSARTISSPNSTGRCRVRCRPSAVAPVGRRARRTWSSSKR